MASVKSIVKPLEKIVRKLSKHRNKMMENNNAIRRERATLAQRMRTNQYEANESTRIMNKLLNFLPEKDS